jgi:hypothetical protein
VKTFSDIIFNIIIFFTIAGKYEDEWIEVGNVQSKYIRVRSQKTMSGVTQSEEQLATLKNLDQNADVSFNSIC